jgi:oxygen-dependent protoporphyrinogen oxidase
MVRAITFSTVKWPHLSGELDIVRCQAGEDGLQRDDTDLVSVAASELAEATGVVGKPVGSVVSRWANSLPQYTVGHLDRVARIRAAVRAQPGLAVCGAAYDGVGVGTCMANAQKAVDQVLNGLR